MNTLKQELKDSKRYEYDKTEMSFKNTDIPALKQEFILKLGLSKD